MKVSTFLGFILICASIFSINAHAQSQRSAGAEASAAAKEVECKTQHEAAKQKKLAKAKTKEEKQKIEQDFANYTDPESKAPVDTSGGQDGQDKAKCEKPPEGCGQICKEKGASKSKADTPARNCGTGFECRDKVKEKTPEQMQKEAGKEDKGDQKGGEQKAGDEKKGGEQKGGEGSPPPPPQEKKEEKKAENQCPLGQSQNASGGCQVTTPTHARDTALSALDSVTGDLTGKTTDKLLNGIQQRQSAGQSREDLVQYASSIVGSLSNVEQIYAAFHI